MLNLKTTTLDNIDDEKLSEVLDVIETAINKGKGA
tara:strand:- start:310 stop:414 length:105 start_codon:yes stop_codon:yes gene_type:complete